MKNKVIMLFVFVVNICIALNVSAKDVEVVFIEVEIYSIPTSKDLTTATLEDSSNLFLSVGSDAVVETGNQLTDIKESDLLKIYFKLDQAGEYFNVNLQLQNKSNESNQSISRLEGNPLNSPLAISASINGITKLVKIKTTKVDNKVQKTAVSATESIAITKDELAKEVANCYVAHLRFRTDFYKNGSAEIYKELIDSLAGKASRNKIINSASIRQSNNINIVGSARNAKIEAKKYCSAIEEKLASLQ